MRDLGFETTIFIEKGSVVYNVSGLYLATKRLFDIIGALFLSLFLLPLFAIKCLYIRLIR